MDYEYLEHTADIKFRAYGKSLEEVFSNSALALRNAMFEGKVKSKVSKKVSVKGKDNERLLFEFLEELLVLLDAQDFLLSKVKSIKIKDGSLEAELVGDKALDYEIHLIVKAITYNEMFVKKEKGKYISQVVVDV